MAEQVRELQEALSAATIALEISSRNARVAAFQESWDLLRAGLELLLGQQGADMIDLPGGASGLLVRDFPPTFGGTEMSGYLPRLAPEISRR